jgi:DNA polymerase sigma
MDTENDFISFGDVSEPPTKKAAKAIPESLSLALEDIDHRAPWARGRKYVSKSKDRTACLHEEILDFVDFISPTAAENKRRSVLLQHFQRITKELWPNAALHVYGSYATGLHLPSSDIDCVVLGCDDPNGLQTLASVIRADGGFDRIQVPILPASHPSAQSHPSALGAIPQRESSCFLQFGGQAGLEGSGAP